mgnify:CR=1 FL=1
MITCQSEVRPANKFMYVGMLRMKKKITNSLYWTVFNAATSQPRDCMLKTAILFPTYLQDKVLLATWKRRETDGKFVQCR